jgi:hypothetical protein
LAKCGEVKRQKTKYVENMAQKGKEGAIKRVHLAKRKALGRTYKRKAARTIREE